MIRRILDWFRVEILPENTPEERAAAWSKIVSVAGLALGVLLFFKWLV